MANYKFKLNQYNWLGQKLLVQHRYSDIVKLRNQRQAASNDDQQLICSDHLSYLSALALIRTSNRLDEIIFTLQRLNFQKNNQYFLLLCQCLVYLGNHDSVVALCKQVFDREINNTTAATTATTTSVDKDTEVNASDGGVDEPAGQLGPTEEAAQSAGGAEEVQGGSDENRRRKLAHQGLDWCLKNVSCDESREFRTAFESINSNPLINDARLWFIFALCLEYQVQFKDADVAFRMACRLASGSLNSNINKADPMASSGPQQLHQPNAPGDGSSSARQLINETAPMSNYHLPHIRYAEFCLQLQNNHKLAMRTLSQADGSSSWPNTGANNPICASISNDYHLSALLALIISSQPQAGSVHLEKSLSILQALDMHCIATKNPSADYNRLARMCKLKLTSNRCLLESSGRSGCFGQLTDAPFGVQNQDELANNLDFALIKSHLLVNNLVQQSDKLKAMYKCPKITGAGSLENSKTDDEERQVHAISCQMDKLIEQLKSFDSSCWSSSAALWNNLGVCYLIKRRLIASLSCLLRAHQMNPLDWRINFNLGLASLHVKLSHRALVCSLAARANFVGRPESPSTRLAAGLSSASLRSGRGHETGGDCALGKTLLAACMAELRVQNEARRLYAEMVAKASRSSHGPHLTETGLGPRMGSGGQQTTSAWAIVNYLLFLSGMLLSSGEKESPSRSQQSENSKLIGHLLDQLEQAWLQRDQNDSQFNVALLELARQLAELWSARQATKAHTRQQVRRAFAWTKQ